MATLTDPDRLQAYRDALSNWSFEGYIRFADTGVRWIEKHLPGITPKQIGELMHEYVEGGGRIDEVRETRPEWSGLHAYHHDLRLEIDGTPVYIETRLNYRLPFAADESSILVVNVHAP